MTKALKKETKQRGRRGRSRAEHRGKRDSRRLLRQQLQYRHPLTRLPLLCQKDPERSPNSGRLSSTTKTYKGEVQGKELKQVKREKDGAPS